MRNSNHVVFNTHLHSIGSTKPQKHLRFDHTSTISCKEHLQNSFSSTYTNLLTVFLEIVVFRCTVYCLLFINLIMAAFPTGVLLHVKIMYCIFDSNIKVKSKASIPLELFQPRCTENVIQAPMIYYFDFRCTNSYLTYSIEATRPKIYFASSYVTDLFRISV